MQELEFVLIVTSMMISMIDSTYGAARSDFVRVNGSRLFGAITFGSLCHRCSHQSLYMELPQLIPVHIHGMQLIPVHIHGMHKWSAHEVKLLQENKEPTRKSIQLPDSGNISVGRLAAALLA